MARIIGGLTTSHVPGLTKAIEHGQQQDPKWKPFFDGFVPVRKWMAEAKPDVVIISYNDHGLNFFLDKMPTFAIGAAHEYRNADEGFGPPRPRVFKGHADLSWHIVESLVAEEFDMTTCQEMVLDHPCTLAGDLIWPDEKWPAVIVPIVLNGIQHPLPTARRCYKLGQALGRALRSYHEDLKILVIGSGGLSHQINLGGYINEEFDHLCMDKIISDPEALTRYSMYELVDIAGIQGLELMNWLVMRGAVPGKVELVTSTYFNPLSHTGGAIMLLDARNNAAAIAAE